MRTSAPPEPAGAEPAGLVAALRRAGLQIPLAATLDLHEALAELDLRRGASLYWAARLTLVADRDDLATFDRVVAEHLGRVAPGTSATEARAATPGAPAHDVAVGRASRSTRADGAAGVVGASVLGLLRDRDLATCTPEERATIDRAIDRLRWTMPTRRSRRATSDGATSARLDLRGAVRAARRLQGEVLDPPHRRRSSRARRVVVLVDVSGSMAPYATAALRLGHVAVRAARAEVFALGTELTRVTAALADPRPDVAVAAAVAAVRDWGGGTRLGAGIDRFVRGWGRRGLARGAVVVVVSDGWEREDPARLGAAVAALRLLAHRVVWVNPLRASPGYRPLAAGMAAALPHCDRFLDGHSFASMERLVEEVASTGR